MTPEMRPPQLLVSRRAILYWTVRALPPWLVLAGMQVVFLVSTGPSSFDAYGEPCWPRPWCWRAGPPDRHAALALPGAPVGDDPGGGLHPVGLVHHRAADRAGVADPDRGQPHRPVRAAVPAGQRHGHHGLGRRSAAGSTGWTGRPPRTLVDDLIRTTQATRRGRDVTSATTDRRAARPRPSCPGAGSASGCSLVHPVMELIRCLPV